ncbi:ParA family protein [Alicyclobacillus tolerans]|uniref:AAA domain-containing protein n=1 Tax=Alicyclobacillus tolerans TaxID=90970 RepID=A0A1M6YLV9_9BACL|nr:AAA family ATPase [Alicyclobacillus montanus]SHL19100.1 AAA domain-containing protein [Alicyclobacillus montanus]
MADPTELVFKRYEAYTRGEDIQIDLPTYARYAVTNFRGGVGKTTLTFNLGYELVKKGQKVLFADVCPQTNLSEMFLRDQFMVGANLYDTLTTEIMPGSGGKGVGGSAVRVGASCPSFSYSDTYLLKGSMDLYLFPGTLYLQLSTAAALMRERAMDTVRSLLLALDRVLAREEQMVGTQKTLIDSSPFFAGATHLAWMAADALIVPVRVDHASIVGLDLLLRMLTDPSMEFIRYLRLGGLERVPKIHSILITHGSWSRRKPYEPDAATRNFVHAAVQLSEQYASVFESHQPEQHVFLLDDFLSSGKVSGERSIPIGELRAGQQFSIRGQKLFINESVVRYQKQLQFLAKLL